MSDKIVQYITRFLLGDDVSRNLVKTIGYTADPSTFHQYNVVIIPSGFFTETVYGHTSSIPSLPLQEIEGIPLLFGTPQTKVIGATLVVHADIIASTYFLIARYEEMLRRDVRDEHGRFPGKESLPFRAGFIHRPIVDEYRGLLRRWLQQTNLRLPDTRTGIRKVYLTHDVDAPFLYRSWKGMLRSLRAGRGLTASMKGKFGPLEADPYYTFPRMIQEDKRLQDSIGRKNCVSVYFLKAGGKSKQDKPRYRLCSRDIQSLLKEIAVSKAITGLHSSYQAGKEPPIVRKEKENLKKVTNKKIAYNRHHFLSCREPEDMVQLEAAGITDDFTLGYADVAGFRLGTSHPVQWINPVNRRLSPLLLHPLTIMDCTLEEEKYMGLKEEDALNHCLSLIEQVEKAGGELILLWHNTAFVEGADSYLHTLYSSLLNELMRK